VTAPAWVVGVDGGGSFGRAWFARADHPPSEMPPGVAEREGSCNPYAVGAEAAGRAILAVIADAQRAAGAPADALGAAFVCIGTAGVERAAEREALAAVLHAGGIARARLRLDSDPWVALEGALPATAVAAGARVMLVAGTGSVAVGIGPNGERRRAGGWGARVGDEGSGAWLGIEAVRAALRALDGRDPPGPLAMAVAAAWGAGPEPLVGRARTATPADFARLAPLVLAAHQDPVAMRLRAEAVAHLGALVVAVARGIAGPGDATRWALAATGGVATALADDLRRSLPERLARAWQAPWGPPVAGAWSLAQRDANMGGE
jgi:glucosamine kinase